MTHTMTGQLAMCVHVNPSSKQSEVIQHMTNMYIHLHTMLLVTATHPPCNGNEEGIGSPVENMTEIGNPHRP